MTKEVHDTIRKIANDMSTIIRVREEYLTKQNGSLEKLRIDIDELLEVTGQLMEDKNVK